MSEAKEKDRILAQIKAFKPHNEIEGLNKHIDELVNGGYAAVRRKSKFPAWHKALRKDLWGLILAILAAVIATYLSKRLGWM